MPGLRAWAGDLRTTSSHQMSSAVPTTPITRVWLKTSGRSMSSSRTTAANRAVTRGTDQVLSRAPVTSRTVSPVRDPGQLRLLPFVVQTPTAIANAQTAKVRPCSFSGADAGWPLQQSAAIDANLTPRTPGEGHMDRRRPEVGASLAAALESCRGHPTTSRGSACPAGSGAGPTAGRSSGT